MVMRFAPGLGGAILWGLLSLCGSAGGAVAQSVAPAVPDANPARPTVSTPARLTPVGYVQLENGGLYAQDSPEFSTRNSFQQVTKLTLHPRLELILQSEPIVRSQAGGKDAFQAGGIAAGAQAVLLPGNNSRPTIAVSYLRSIYSGPAPDIDIGSANQSAQLLVSGDLFGFHADANGIVNEQQDSALRRAQWGETLSVSRPIGKFTISGEIWHFSQPLVRAETTGNLWAVSYALRGNLVLDAAVNRGFNATSTRWEVLYGFTYLIPHRLWKSHAAPGSNRFSEP
jgi:hypothetical protein